MSISSPSEIYPLRLWQSSNESATKIRRSFTEYAASTPRMKMHAPPLHTGLDKSPHLLPYHRLDATLQIVEPLQPDHRFRIHRPYLPLSLCAWENTFSAPAAAASAAGSG